MRAACHILTCSLLVWCAAVPAAMAGDDGLSDKKLVELDVLAPQKSLSDGDKAELAKAINVHIKALESDDAEEVSAARKDLAAWSTGVATPVFRGEFSKLACQPLSDVVKRAKPLQAINAIEVLRVVRTHESIKALALLGSNAESPTLNVGVRLAASRAVLAGIDAGTDMNSAQAEGLVRLLTAAAKSESEWMGALSQLSALGSIAKRSGMDAKVVSAARAGQVAGLGAIAAKVGNGDPKNAPLLKCASRVLSAMRLDLASAPSTERSTLSGTLLPVVESLRKAGLAPPAGADADLAAAYADTVKAADLMAQLLKASGKPAAKPTGKPAAKPAPKKPTN
jgi:hypothetical protein